MPIDPEKESIVRGFSDWLHHQFEIIRRIDRKIEERLAKRQCGAKRGRKVWRQEKDVWKQEVLRYWEDSDGLGKYIKDKPKQNNDRPTQYRFIDPNQQICIHTVCNGRCGRSTPSDPMGKNRRQLRFTAFENIRRTMYLRRYHPEDNNNVESPSPDPKPEKRRYSFKFMKKIRQAVMRKKKDSQTEKSFICCSASGPDTESHVCHHHSHHHSDSEEPEVTSDDDTDSGLSGNESIFSLEDMQILSDEDSDEVGGGTIDDLLFGHSTDIEENPFNFLLSDSQ